MEPKGLTSCQANNAANTGSDMKSYSNATKNDMFDDDKNDDNMPLTTFEETTMTDTSATGEGGIDDDLIVLKTRAKPVLRTTTKPSETVVSPTLSRQEWFHLICLLLAWACVVSCLTLAVGSSAVVVLAVGGSSNMAPFALGMFFLGQSLVSLLITPWVFAQYGRKIGFYVGSFLGFIGTVICVVAIKQHSPVLVIVGNLPLGAGAGMGMYLRFAAVEVVPAARRAFAISLVLSGGCLAAFIGPEAAYASKSIFGEELPYMGVYMMTGIFQALNSFFVSLVRFPAPQQKEQNPSTTTNQTRTPSFFKILRFFSNVFKLFYSKQFLLSLLVGALSWTIMAMPMSLVRVAMKEVGYYSSRQSLLVIELHFLGMYFPGFISGKFIQRYGTMKAIGVSILCFGMGLFCNILATFDKILPSSVSLLPWTLGLALLGCGWNFGFSAATVELTTVYENKNNITNTNTNTVSKVQVQAANDFLMFLVSGSGIFSSGYIYQAGARSFSISIPGEAAAVENACNGWRLLNYICFGFTGLLLLIALVYVATAASNKKRQDNGDNENNGEEEFIMVFPMRGQRKEVTLLPM